MQVPGDIFLLDVNPKPSKPTFEDGNPYVYHTREVPTDYVHLTPKSASECIYERLMDGKPSSYETVLCRSHVLNEEGHRGYHSCNRAVTVPNSVTTIISTSSLSSSSSEISFSSIDVSKQFPTDEDKCF
ncbi:nephrin [Caerostris extrusa]|uniref:Nephrin n=1 Tax=Caerostris extrusa TaxID=172846 RepID=A0AAV4SIU1_CAEEX|nr:nephrin [Caerostris extrusa]